MHFIDDEDLVAVARGSKADRSNDRFANVINSGVRRSVDLLHVDRPALRNFAARGTRIGVVRATGSSRWRLRLVAIERLSEQARGSCFADAARAREKIGVMKPLMLDGVAQRARNWLLPGDFIKSLWAPFACDYLVGHRK